MLGKKIKSILMLVFSLSIVGCIPESGTNKHDAKTVEVVVNGTVELTKIENEKLKEEKRQKLMEKDASAAAQAEMRISDNETSVELRKTMDVTAIEQKKLDMQDKTILDVNKSEERKMEYEMRKLELEMELKRLELEKAKRDSEAKANELANKKAQAERATAQARKAAAQAKQNEIDIYKSIIND